MHARTRFLFFVIILLVALVANLALPITALADGAPTPPPPASDTSAQPAQPAPASNTSAQPAQSAPASDTSAQPAQSAPASDTSAQPAQPPPASDTSAQPAQSAPVSDTSAQPAPASDTSAQPAQPPPASDSSSQPAQPAPASDTSAQPPQSAPASDTSSQPAQAAPTSASSDSAQAAAASDTAASAQPAQGTDASVATQDSGTVVVSGTSVAAGTTTGPNAPAATDTSVAPTDTSSHIPAGTPVAVVNGAGTVEPLATQAAAKIIATGDPIWCPNGSSPVANSNGCTDSSPDLASLVSTLSGTQPGQDGTIWITAGTDASGSDIHIDGSSLTTWANYTLTLQGGWNGSSAGAITGTSYFSNSIFILNWNNHVTVNDITFSGTGSYGLIVTATGDIRVHHVTSKNNRNGSGAYLDNCRYDFEIGNCTAAGSIHVDNSAFNNNGYDGLDASSTGNIALVYVIANDNNNQNSDGAYLDNCQYDGGSGGCIGTGSIRVDNGTFIGNGSNGLEAYSKDSITLTNVMANGNGANGAYLNNSGGTASILIDNGTFDNNIFDGLQALSNGDITINCSDLSSNANYGVRDDYSSPLTLNGVALGGNGSGGYFSNSMASINPVGCGGPSAGRSRPAVAFLPVHTIPVTGGEENALDCTQYSGTKLLLPDMDSAFFPCPIKDSASLGSLALDKLPGSLPNGDTFGSALTITVIKNGVSNTDLNGLITVSFAIPDSMKNARLAILHWDGSQWVEVPGGHMTADGHFEAPTNLTGTFVLVSR